MNAPFKNLTTDGLESAEDRVGGYAPIDSDIYNATIKAMYAGQSEGGAHNVTLITDINGRENRETIYVTNKKGENFFLNKNDKTKKVPLPGFTMIDDICLIATGAPLSEQATEKKMVNVYDKDAGREIPKEVDMLVDCLGKPVTLAILRQLENKSKLENGSYVDTAETREINVIEKAFDPESRMTVVEARNEASEPGFYDTWLAKNQGVIRDRRTIKDGEGGNVRSGRPGGAAPQSGGGGERRSLFGNK